MNDRFLHLNRKKPARTPLDFSPIIRAFLLVAAAIILIYVATIPWRNYVFSNLIKKGDELLSNLNYTEAYVNYEKAKLLAPARSEAKEKMDLAQKAVGDLRLIRDLLAEKNPDLLQMIENAEQKSCDIEKDQKLIDNNYPQIAIINLEFCTADDRGDLQSWSQLGVAYLRYSESDKIFKEQKPELRQKARDAFEQAYYADPTQKLALENLVKINQIIGDDEKVDYWQKLLDNLVRFQNIE